MVLGDTLHKDIRYRIPLRAIIRHIIRNMPPLERMIDTTHKVPSLATVGRKGLRVPLIQRLKHMLFLIPNTHLSPRNRCVCHPNIPTLLENPPYLIIAKHRRNSRRAIFVIEMVVRYSRLHLRSKGFSRRTFHLQNSSISVWHRGNQGWMRDGLRSCMKVGI